jgi:hypothetical protein
MLKKLSKTIIVGLVISLLLLICGPVQAQPSDIQGHWAEAQISDWVDKGLAQGYPDGSFKPDNTISRAEFISLTNHAFAFNETASSSFSDVAANDWFAGEIARSQAAGYITGYENGTMRPNQEISRQEVATILAKIAKLETTANNAALNSFNDAGDIPAWSQGAITAVVAKDLMHGYPDQTFRAQAGITRAEAIISLNNLINANILPAQPVITYDQAGVFGPASATETINGNVIISVAGVTLQNCNITGNLTLAQGVGEGNVSLKNVTVQGTTYINGGGANSVTLENCTLPRLTITKAGVRVVASGSTSVRLVKLENGATLVEVTVSGVGFENVTLAETIPAGANITLTGSFDKVEVAADSINVAAAGAKIAQLDVAATAGGCKIDLDSNSKVNTLGLNAAVSVTGQGTIDTAKIGAAGTNIEQKPATIENPQNYSFPTNAGTTGGSSSTQSITISDVGMNNTFGSFKFSTNVVTTADNILAKVKVNGVPLESVVKRNDGEAGKAWKAFVTDPEKDKDYTITCESPFTLTGTSVLRWPSVISASAVTDIEVEDIGDSKNGSDLQVSFSKAAGENQRIDSYRVMVVRSASAGAFNLAAANAVSSDCYTVVEKTGADNYTITLDGAKDTAGNSITNGIAYKVFVLSIADGTNATLNGLSNASAAITLTTSGGGGGGGGGGDVTPPAFVDTYPKLINIGSQTADMLVKIGEAGTVYYVVLPDNDTAPIAAQVKAGLTSNGDTATLKGNMNLSANTEATISITGLSAKTAYDIYVVAEDTKSNLQSSPVKVDLQTSDQSTAIVTTPANMTRRNDINLSITGAKDSDGIALDGSFVVAVASDKAGVSFNNSVTFTGGAATVAVPTGDETTGFATPTELGLHTLTVTIDGVTQSQTVSVTIADSAIDNTKSTVSIEPEMGEGTTSVITVTLRDSNNNLLANTTKNMKIVVTITNNDLANAESYSINEPYKTVDSTTDLNATATIISNNTPTDANGQYSFTITLPTIIDIGDGISVQVTQNQITKEIGGLFTYIATD